MVPADSLHVSFNSLLASDCLNGTGVFLIPVRYLDDVPSEADPCFAKVVDGFEARSRMHALPLHPEDKGFALLNKFVTITRAELVN